MSLKGVPLTRILEEVLGLVPGSTRIRRARPRGRGKPLTKAQIADLANWIGARWGDEYRPARAEREEGSP